MKSLILTILPLCSALTGNHVQVSIGGSSYSHAAMLDKPPPVPEVSPSYPIAAPVYHKPAPFHPKPAPVHYTQVPSYPTTAPVYHQPGKIYLTETPSYPTAAPVHHQPDPIYYPGLKYQTPKQNCSVVDEVVKAEVCIPAFERKCAFVHIKVIVIVDKEQCQNITRTVCSSAEEVIENKICVYSYEKQSEDTVAKTVEVTFAKECTSQRVTVCQPAQAHSYQSYGHQYCKEEDQETCYNVPKVTGVDTKVSVVYPSPVKSCSDKPITIPRISCEDIIDEKCITLPEIKKETEKVEKCEVSLAEPTCQDISLTLPKQVCVGLVYGHAVELTAQQYHAKV